MDLGSRHTYALLLGKWLIYLVCVSSVGCCSAVFILGFGIIVYIRKIRWMAVVFSLAYFIQIIGLSTEKLSFVWVTVFLILLYFIGKMTQSNVAGKVFETFAPLFMFLFAVFHVLFVDMELNFYQEINIAYFVIHIFLMSLIVLYLYSRQELFFASCSWLYLFQAFVVPEISDYLASVALFIFSVSLLMEGFNRRDRQQMNIGTASFLISTFVVYTKVAWGYLSQSLFFLIAGVILLGIGYLLNRQQKVYTEGGGELQIRKKLLMGLVGFQILFLFGMVLSGYLIERVGETVTLQTKSDAT